MTFIGIIDCYYRLQCPPAITLGSNVQLATTAIANTSPAATTGFSVSPTAAVGPAATSGLTLVNDFTFYI
nr:hypothetical protein BgiMline_011212 [Biomphalaria glabrata]